MDLNQLQNSFKEITVAKIIEGNKVTHKKTSNFNKSESMEMKKKINRRNAPKTIVEQ